MLNEVEVPLDCEIDFCLPGGFPPPPPPLTSTNVVRVVQWEGEETETDAWSGHSLARSLRPEEELKQ